jgi:hypothetical protein
MSPTFFSCGISNSHHCFLIKEALKNKEFTNNYMVVFYNFFGPTSTLYELYSIDLTGVSLSSLVVSPTQNKSKQ